MKFAVSTSGQAYLVRTIVVQSLAEGRSFSVDPGRFSEIYSPLEVLPNADGSFAIPVTRPVKLMRNADGRLFRVAPSRFAELYTVSEDGLQATNRTSGKMYTILVPPQDLIRVILANGQFNPTEEEQAQREESYGRNTLEDENEDAE